LPFSERIQDIFVILLLYFRDFFKKKKRSSMKEKCSNAIIITIKITITGGNISQEREKGENPSHQSSIGFFLPDRLACLLNEARLYLGAYIHVSWRKSVRTSSKSLLVQSCRIFSYVSECLCCVMANDFTRNRRKMAQSWIDCAKKEKKTTTKKMDMCNFEWEEIMKVEIVWKYVTVYK
jgi:hypothetical protein